MSSQSVTSKSAGPPRRIFITALIVTEAFGCDHAGFLAPWP
jgi:hypothetical protein